MGEKGVHTDVVEADRIEQARRSLNRPRCRRCFSLSSGFLGDRRQSSF